MQTLFNLKAGANVVVPGVAQKTTTVRRVVAGALAGSSITFNGQTAPVEIEAGDLSAALNLPVSLAAGADFIVTAADATPVTVGVTFDQT